MDRRPARTHLLPYLILPLAAAAIYLAFAVRNEEAAKGPENVPTTGTSREPAARALSPSGIPGSTKEARSAPAPRDLPEHKDDPTRTRKEGTLYPEPVGDRDPYARSQLISMEETAPDAQGNFERIRVVRTDFKYPIVRVAEKLRQDPASGNVSLVDRQAMVGDHVMVSLKPGTSADELAEVARRFGGEVRAQYAGSALFLVSFDGSAPRAVEQVVAQLKAETKIRGAEPDFIVHAR